MTDQLDLFRRRGSEPQRAPAQHLPTIRAAVAAEAARMDERKRPTSLKVGDRGVYRGEPVTSFSSVTRW